MATRGGGNTEDENRVRDEPSIHTLQQARAEQHTARTNHDGGVVLVAARLWQSSEKVMRMLVLLVKERIIYFGHVGDDDARSTRRRHVAVCFRALHRHIDGIEIQKRVQLVGKSRRGLSICNNEKKQQQS